MEQFAVAHHFDATWNHVSNVGSNVEQNTSKVLQPNQQPVANATGMLDQAMNGNCQTTCFIGQQDFTFPDDSRSLQAKIIWPNSMHNQALCPFCLHTKIILLPDKQVSSSVVCMQNHSGGLSKQNRSKAF